MKQFKFHCKLINKNTTEEEFDFIISSDSFDESKKTMEKILYEEWGRIVRRVYFNEKMKSDRYWSIELKEINVLRKTYEN